VETGGFQSVVSAAGTDRGITNGEPGTTTAQPSTLDPGSSQLDQTQGSSLAFATAETGVETISIELPINLTSASGAHGSTNSPQTETSVTGSISAVSGAVDPAALDASLTTTTGRSAPIIGSVSRSGSDGSRVQ